MKKIGKKVSKKDCQMKIDKYFAECDEKGKPYSFAGLALALGINRDTLLSYSDNDRYFKVIEKARNTVLRNLEERAIEKGNSAVMYILKSCGLKEKLRNEQTGDIYVNFNIPRPGKKE